MHFSKECYIWNEPQKLSCPTFLFANEEFLCSEKMEMGLWLHSQDVAKNCISNSTSSVPNALLGAVDQE